jgi:hypothetical protein
MKKNALMVGVAAIAGLAAFTVLPAQEPSPPNQLKMGKGGGRSGPMQPVAANTVTGAPYSADVVTENTQVLADGNRIETRFSAKLYRDSQGRERREDGPGGLIMISDPVANAGFTLNPKTHTGRKGGIIPALLSARGELIDGPRLVAAGQLHLVVSEHGTASFKNVGAVTSPASPELATEQLGSQSMEGVLADGVRITHTIPAGQVGNQRPIQVVDESWYSPDLKMVIMTRLSDPRSPEVVYRLANINRNEPDSSLFQAPPDYKIEP